MQADRLATMAAAENGARSPRARMTGSERRQQLIEIAKSLFAERGYDGTSIEEIAQRANVSKPVVYEHFGGKEGLYAVVVDREQALADGAAARDGRLADAFAQLSDDHADERAQTVDFSEPYAVAQLAILANANSNISSIDDLNQPGKTVAVKTGSTGDTYATNNLTNATIVRLADESACVTEVSQGKADGFLYDQLTIYREQKSNPGTTKAVYIAFQDPEKWGIAVQKGNTELLGQLNEFIETSKTDGEYDKLTDKYLSEEKAAFDELGFKWFFDLS